MTTTVLARAQAGDEEAFRELTDPYRRELERHCYRLLGSAPDAEDVLQEVLLAAWRGLDRFEERTSVRAWLYRIATNRCLNALRDAGRRPRPALPAVPQAPEPTRREPAWFGPAPDTLLEGLPDGAPGPEARYEAREGLALAFVAGLAGLPPRQRAVLVLRDSLGFPAAEVAGMLDSSEVSVNSALARARAALARRVPAGGAEQAPLPRSARERALVGRFVDAFEAADVQQVVALLTEDAWMTMPPVPLQYQGHDAIARFYQTRGWWAPGAARLVPTRANGQPALGYYVRDPATGARSAHGLIVLTLAGDRISAITRFEAGLLPRFGLPATLPT